jgi:hypothetical protein
MQAFTKRFTIPINFPLKFVTKQNILDNISRRVVQNVWICELPKKKRHSLVACKECTACLTIAGQLHIWEKRNGESYVRNVIRYFNDEQPTYEVHELKDAPPTEPLILVS